MGYEDGMFRVAAPWLALAVAIAAAGAVMYVTTDGVLEALAFGLVGVAGVIAVSAVFYAVGVSEDREHQRRR
jgi:hypothetical protein